MARNLQPTFYMKTTILLASLSLAYSASCALEEAPPEQDLSGSQIRVVSEDAPICQSMQTMKLASATPYGDTLVVKGYVPTCQSTRLAACVSDNFGKSNPATNVIDIGFAGASCSGKPQLQKYSIDLNKYDDVREHKGDVMVWPNQQQSLAFFRGEVQTKAKILPPSDPLCMVKNKKYPKLTMSARDGDNWIISTTSPQCEDKQYYACLTAQKAGHSVMWMHYTDKGGCDGSADSRDVVIDLNEYDQLDSRSHLYLYPKSVQQTDR